MNIITSLNENYSIYTYIMLKSLFINNISTDITVYLLYAELSKKSIDKLCNLADEYQNEINYIEIETSLFPDELRNSPWGIEAYFRLMMFDVLPEIDRAIYIDADTIVNGSLSTIYTIDFGEKNIYGCKETNHFDDARTDLFGPIFEKNFTYINSGVMLLNIEALRKKYNFQQYIDVITEIKDIIFAVDQDVINYVHWKEIGYLEDSFVDNNVYNLVARLASNNGWNYEKTKREAVIVHYAGFKPWAAEHFHYDIELLWWDYAKKTKFFDGLCRKFMKETILNTRPTEVAMHYVEQNNQLRQENEQLLLRLNESISINRKMINILQNENGKNDIIKIT